MRLPLALSLMLLTFLMGLLVGQYDALPKLWESQHNQTRSSPPADSAGPPWSVPEAQALEEHVAAVRTTLQEQGVAPDAIAQHVEAVRQFHRMNAAPSSEVAGAQALEEHVAAVRTTLQEQGVAPDAIAQHVEAVIQQLQHLSPSPSVPR